MVRVVFSQHCGEPVGFLLHGHAGAGNSGSDIVCAAVSSAALMTANTVTEVLGVPAEIAERDGYLSVAIPAAYQAQCAALLRGLVLHFTALADQYPKNIQVSFTEV